jgi:hypothetical protein
VPEGRGGFCGPTLNQENHPVSFAATPPKEGNLAVKAQYLASSNSLFTYLWEEKYPDSKQAPLFPEGGEEV